MRTDARRLFARGGYRDDIRMGEAKNNRLNRYEE